MANGAKRLGARAGVSLRVAAACALLGMSASLARAGEKFAYFQYRSQSNVDEVRGCAVGDDGTLTELAGSPYPTTDDSSNGGASSQTMEAVKVGKQTFLFTASVSGVTSWSVAPDGELSMVAGSPFDGGLGAEDFIGTAAVKRGSKWFLYAAANDVNSIAAFGIQTDGSLVAVAGSPFATGLGPIGLDAVGDTLVCANVDGDSISSFEIQTDGSLVPVPGSPLAVPSGLTLVKLDDKGKFVWSVNDTSNVNVWSVDSATSALTLVAGAPFDLALLSGYGIQSPGTKFILVFGRSTVTEDPSIDVMARAKDGSLSLLGRHCTGFSEITAHAVDKKGKLLFLIGDDDGSQNVAMYRLDPKTGEMIIADQKNVPLDAARDAEIVEL